MEAVPLDVFLPIQSAADVSLWEAAANDDVSALRRILRPDTINALDEDYGQTPCMHACAMDSICALRLLFDHGCDLDYQTNRGATAVFTAAASGSLRCLRFLIHHGAHVDVPHRDTTALQWLLAPLRISKTGFETRLHAGRRSAAQVLVLAGANVESPALCHHASRKILCDWARSQLVRRVTHRQSAAAANQPCPPPSIPARYTKRSTFSGFVRCTTA